MTRSKCQECFNFDCNWHKFFEPVDGWTATPTIIHEQRDGKPFEIASYLVLDCPLYKARRGCEGRKRVTIKDIVNDMGVPIRSINRWLKNGHVKEIKEFYISKGYKFVREKLDKHYHNFIIPIQGVEHDGTRNN